MSEPTVTLILCEACGKKLGQSIENGTIDLSKLEIDTCGLSSAVFVEAFEGLEVQSDD